MSSFSHLHHNNKKPRGSYIVFYKHFFFYKGGLYCFFFAKMPLLAGIYYLNWPHVPLKYIRFFQLFSLSRLNTLVIISIQDSSITMALVSLQRQYAEENRALQTQGISRVQPNKHPLHCNLTRFTHCAPSCFVCALRQCLQFIQRL